MRERHVVRVLVAGAGGRFARDRGILPAGGFPEWLCADRPDDRRSFTRGFAIVVNGALLAAAGVFGWMGSNSSRGSSPRLISVAILGADAFLHVIGTRRTCRAWLPVCC